MTAGKVRSMYFGNFYSVRRLRVQPVLNGILAEIDGESITTEQVEKAIGASLATLQEEIYNLRRQKLEAMINDRLLAKEAAALLVPGARRPFPGLAHCVSRPT